MTTTALEKLDLWLKLSENEQDASINQLAQKLQDEYIYQYTLSYTNNPAFRIPTFKHLPTELEFNLIIGGEFNMGLSEREEVALRSLIQKEGLDEEFLGSMDSMRPVHSVRLRPFLMSRLPIINSFAMEYIEVDLDDYISDYDLDLDSDRKIISATLTRDQVNQIMDKLRFRLPSEAQWEYAYRGGTSTLFYWGDNIIDEERITIAEFSDREKCQAAANPFGLVGLAVGEWCADSFTPDYSNAPGDDLPVIGDPPYIVRGGAAMLSPWQNCGEWVTCISAMRQAADIDDVEAGRFVKLLDL
ncbi:MAG TPA: hypothetical protein DEG17_12400 [Cyanobacteria bacterium UBA11149]|nr:hypothetical protein [Cyanobacteria bacterium UBA11367]HBE59999.1 hypothetical protein [Cyanobacteria bacterium UBA11366]HBK63953.1 hypothetical protein [Cyanobacteria bacterium UBA11166]HBR75255.1 hypothetical protein [Cyanobacteria bacterium UBA11159]HBS70503.1 hypothetical protein [Cyanobacteria bacterium UBA11153]HBW89646.1 hypothetical protein [Cyanobacteria bacterium UBA11149]HCA97397.1 hypothetical protein [Cyanobacteria bacterium UBA9226]